MSSPPSALGDVVDFLRAHPPFDALELADVERAAAAAEVEFFLAGTTIFAQSAQPIEHLRVVRTGAVEIVLGDRVLDLLGPGELFGHASMLSGLPPGFAARAQEDTLCYRIPEEVARGVLARPESVGFVARSLLEMHTRLPTALAPRRSAPDPANQPVAALIRDPPLLCSPATTIREAAAKMAGAPATSIVIELGDSLGILTDRDLRSRVVAAGVSYEDPVSSVMSAPAYTVEPDRLGGDVLLEMLDRGVRHFPVVTAGREVIGVVEAVDLLAVETLSSFYLRRSIASARSVAELARAAQGLRPAVIALHDARVAASSVAAIYSVVLDALTRRLIELALAIEPHPPAPPAEFSWLALGSQSRREATPGLGCRQRDRLVRGRRGAGGPAIPAHARRRGRRWAGRVRDPRRQPRRDRVGRAVRALDRVLAEGRARLDGPSHPRAGADPRLGARRQPAGVGHPQRQPGV